MDERTIGAALQALPFWNGLTDAEKQQVRASAVTKVFPPNSIIHDGGKDCLGLLVLQRGMARVYLPSPQGREVTLFHLPSGSISVLSASCVIDQITFDTIIMAETECEVLVVPAGLVARLQEQNLSVRSFVFQAATECFSQVMDVMQQLLFWGLDNRLAKFLLAYLGYKGGDCVYMTHEQIAQEINSAREVVARQLKQWVNAGYVALERGRVRVLDRAALQQLARGRKM